MPVSLLGVTEAFGLPPVKLAHGIVTGVGVAVTRTFAEGAEQVASYWLYLGVQVPNVPAVGAGVVFAAYQAVVIVSSAVLTLMYRVFAGIVPEMVIEIPL